MIAEKIHRFNNSVLSVIQTGSDDQTNCSLGFYKQQQATDDIAPQAELKEIDILSVFPNPANDMVTIYHNIPEGKAVEIAVVNTLGQVVKTQPVNWTEYTTTIEVKPLATGIYNLLFKVNGKVVESKKIIKQ